MPNLYLLFSHELTDRQKKEARRDLGVKQIYYLPDDLKKLWSQIPPEIPEITEYVQPVKEWLTRRLNEGDYVLIQGDFGATYQMVQWAFSQNCRPIYATTKRKIVEIYNNEEIITNRVFEHVRFRFYKQD